MEGLISEFPRVRPMGEHAILVEFEVEINEDLLDRVLSSKRDIEEFYAEARVEVIHTYTSLLIIYDVAIEKFYGEISAVKKLLNGPKIQKKMIHQLFRLPVCFHSDFAVDSEHISTALNLSVDEITHFHTQPSYTVFFTGFLPGFLYLGGLDKRLVIPRRKQPRLKVPNGAVGIGGNQTGIYPRTSPGGWQIIGNSPVQLFDVTSLPPCEISAGDKIKFYEISKDEHQYISEEVKSGNFHLEREEYHG